MATTHELRVRFINLLYSKAAQKIDFTLENIRVHGGSFSLVATALSLAASGFPGLYLEHPSNRVPKDAGMAYDAALDSFLVRRKFEGTEPYERAAVIHEGVHAFLDLNVPSNNTVPGVIAGVLLKTTKLTDEAAAYVAGALFHLYDTAAGQKAKAPKWAKDVPLFLEAHRIAVGIMNHNGASVSDADVKALKDKILADSTYDKLQANPSMTSGNNGLRMRI